MTTGMLQPREQQRRRMLREMGITPWIPRQALPAAAASHAMIFSLANSVEEVSTNDQVSADSAQANTVTMAQVSPVTPQSNTVAMDQARQMLGQGEKPPSPAENSLTEQNQSATPDVSIIDRAGQPPEAAPSETLAFNFTWVGVNERLALLAMMPGTDTRIPSAQRDMMKRMLVALDPRIDTSHLKARLFRWPLPGLSHVDSSAATNAVNGFVAKQLSDRPAANLLVLSDGVPVFLKHSINVGQMGGWEPFNINVLCTHAMHEMVDSPSIKREAWQHMQALRQRLTQDKTRTEHD